MTPEEAYALLKLIAQLASVIQQPREVDDGTDSGAASDQHLGGTEKD